MLLENCAVRQYNPTLNAYGVAKPNWHRHMLRGLFLILLALELNPPYPLGSGLHLLLCPNESVQVPHELG
jgi:hypothetical protein